MNEVETHLYRGFTIRVRVDEDPQNPREDDNLTVMACFHKRHDLGDKDHGFEPDDYNGLDELEAAIVKQEDTAVILPLYLYDHSGLTINTTGFSCPWDSGRLGFVWITKEKARKEFGWKHITAKRLAKLQEILLSDVQVYDDFLTGSVYGYNIEDPDGNETDESCWGYFGHDSIKDSGYLVKDAEYAVDRLVEERASQASEAAREALPENRSDQLALGLSGVA